MKISEELGKCTKSVSNPESVIDNALSLFSKLAMVWRSSDTDVKEKLQNPVFSEGIVYDRENEGFRTPKVNYIFTRIASLSGNTGANGKRD